MAPQALLAAGEAKKELQAAARKKDSARVPGVEEDVPQRHDGPAMLTLFWRVLSGRPNFETVLSEWAKVAKIAIVMVGGKVSDKRTFSVMNWVTGDDRISLTAHLEFCVRFAELGPQAFNDFPLLEALGEPLAE